MSTVKRKDPDTGEDCRFEYKGLQLRDPSSVKVDVYRAGKHLGEVRLQEDEGHLVPNEKGHLTDKQARKLIKRAEKA